MAVCISHVQSHAPLRTQVHPTTFLDPKQPDAHSKILAPEALRGHGAILVDGQGKRFVDELATRDAVTAAMNCAVKPIWMILPQVRFELPRCSNMRTMEV